MVVDAAGGFLSAAIVGWEGWAEGGHDGIFFGKVIWAAVAAVSVAVVVMVGRAPALVSKTSTATALIPSAASIEASTAAIKGTEGAEVMRELAAAVGAKGTEGAKWRAAALGAGAAAAGPDGVRARLIATNGRPGFRGETVEVRSEAVVDAAAALEGLGRVPVLPIPAHGAEDEGPAEIIAN